MAKGEGDEVLSGAYCAAGAGDYEVEHVGADSFAERIASEARGTRALLSPLQRDINTVLKITVAAMVPLAIALVVALALQDRGITDSVDTAVAALVPLVPEGLVLLTSLTFAVAAVRLGRLGTLAQRLNRSRAWRAWTRAASTRPARSPTTASGSRASRRRRATRRTRPASCWGRWRRASGDPAADRVPAPSDRTALSTRRVPPRARDRDDEAVEVEEALAAPRDIAGFAADVEVPPRRRLGDGVSRSPG